MGMKYIFYFLLNVEVDRHAELTELAYTHTQKCFRNMYIHRVQIDLCQFSGFQKKINSLFVN